MDTKKIRQDFKFILIICCLLTELEASVPFVEFKQLASFRELLCPRHNERQAPKDSINLADRMWGP